MSDKVRGFERVKQYAGDEHIKLPTRSTQQSAGYDFVSAFDYHIYEGEMQVVRTGIKAYMQPDEVLLLFDRSSNAKKGLSLANSVGVVDADYYSNPNNDGHIMFMFDATQDITIKSGDRIGQGIFVKYLLADNDNATATREAGFGSTGN